MAIYERLGKRNLTYNNRHRLYGRKMIMEDIDAYECNDNDDVVVMFETKHGNVREINLSDRQFIRQIKIANKLGVPFFCLVYYILGKQKQLLDADQSNEEPSHVQYYLIPVNERALQIVSEPEAMTEAQYVKFLYKLRGEEEIEAETKLFDKWIFANSISLPEIKS